MVRVWLLFLFGASVILVPVVVVVSLFVAVVARTFRGRVGVLPLLCIGFHCGHRKGRLPIALNVDPGC